jgi:hypothetical protein
MKNMAQHLTKIVYVDRLHRPNPFNSKLKYMFTGYSPFEVSKEFNDIGAKNLPSKRRIVHLQVPQETLLKLEGSFKLTYQIEFVLSMRKGEATSSQIKRLKST